MIKAGIILAAMLVLLCILTAAGFYAFVFYYPERLHEDPYAPEKKENYGAYAKEMADAIREMDAQPYEEVTIQSRDGYALYGRLYETCPGRPVEIFFHGYHGTRYWDGYGCFWFCRKYGHNLLMVDERAHGKSGSRTITFGICERYDCLAWAQYVAKRMGKETPIILSGVSMGSATVLMAADLPLPDSVRAIIADCGYTSPEAVIGSIARKQHIPVKTGLFFTRLGGRLFGHFNLRESEAVKSVRNTTIPILFIHGTEDQVVPPEMCDELYEACGSFKRRMSMPGAGHAVNAQKDLESYMQGVADFLKSCEIL